MIHQPSSHREDSLIQKDLTKLQQREQRIVAKLAEAREVQTRALKRFAEAQARVLLLENHLQALRARLQPSQSSPTQATSPAPTSTSDAQPVQSAPEPALHAEANTVQPSTSQAAHKRESIHSPDVAPEPATQHVDQAPEQEHEIIRPLSAAPEATDQPTGGTELLARISAMSAGIPRETLPQTGELAAPDLLAEDLDETVRRTIRPPTSPAPQEIRMDQAEEDALLAAILAMAHEPTNDEDETQKSARQTVQKAEQSLNEVNLAILNGTLSGSEADNALHEAEVQVAQARAQLAASGPAPDASTSTASESDITDKLPVMHDRDARMREPQ